MPFSRPSLPGPVPPLPIDSTEVAVSVESLTLHFWIRVPPKASGAHRYPCASTVSHVIEPGRSKSYRKVPLASYLRTSLEVLPSPVTARYVLPSRGSTARAEPTPPTLPFGLEKSPSQVPSREKRRTWLET